MLSEDLLQDFAHIFQHVPTVEDLFGLWSSNAGSFEIAAPTISADDLNSRMSEKPIGEHLLVTAQQNLNWSVVLQIDE